MKIKSCLPVLFMFFLIINLTNTGNAQKIYQWRGENREGIYNENNLLKKWPEQGPQLLWFTEEIGAGYAAPVVTSDKVIVNGESKGISYLFAFDLKGKLLWKVPNGKEFAGKEFSANYPGARSTPTVADDLVYTISGTGRIACFEVTTGNEKWAIEMVSGLNGIENEFGYSESPLVDGNIVYCTPGGTEKNVVALDRFTGKTIWTSKTTGDTTSFCSPVIFNLPNCKMFVSIARHHIYGLNANTGELLWSQKLEKFIYEGEHCNTPVFADGFLYYTAGDENGNGTVKLEISRDGKSIKEIWRNKSVGNAFGGMVKIGSTLFLTGRQKKLFCLDTNTGNALDSIKPNNGRLIYSDGMFYCYSESGEIKLIDFQNNKFSEISKFKIDKGNKEHFSHPVIANGVLYIRHGKALMAYDIKKN